MKRNDLIIGYVYVLDTGAICVYLGRDKRTQNYIFYTINSCIVLHNGRIYNYELMHPYVVDSCNKVMTRKLDMEGVVVFNILSSVLLRYPDLDYSSIIKTWIAKNRLLINNFNFNLDFSYNPVDSQNFVKVKDLVVGKLYVSRNETRDSYYLYLGKNRKGEFCWVQFGWVGEYLAKWGDYINDRIRYNLKVTKSMKKLSGVAPECENTIRDVSPYRDFFY